MSLGYVAELKHESGGLIFETATAVKAGHVNFEIVAAGSSGNSMRWKRRGKSHAYVSSGGGGEYAYGELTPNAGDKIRIDVGATGTGNGTAGGDSRILINGKEAVVVKGAPWHDSNQAGQGGTGGTIDPSKASATFVRGHAGQWYHDVGEHNPLPMTGGSSGDPNGICTDDPTGKHYAGNFKYVSSTSSERVGSGGGAYLNNRSYPKYGGYVRLSDRYGVLHGTKNQPIIYCNFLIRL